MNLPNSLEQSYDKGKKSILPNSFCLSAAICRLNLQSSVYFIYRSRLNVAEFNLDSRNMFGLKFNQISKVKLIQSNPNLT
jgi:hypothetical protein